MAVTSEREPRTALDVDTVVIGAGISGLYQLYRLRELGQRINHKRIARLMRTAGLRGITRRKFRGTTQRDAAAIGAADLVERQFVATAPNQLWVADITYVPTWAGFLYLAIVLDVFSRRIVHVSRSCCPPSQARSAARRSLSANCSSAPRCEW